jgi:SAM-dependent methyltransferase
MPGTHYDETYFSWQSSVGDAGAVLNRRKFLPYLNAKDTVLDFGCGNGALLAGLPVAVKLGVEVSSHARAAATARGLTVYEATREIPKESVDVVISNHALEHVERPLDELRAIHDVLRPGGLSVLVVPIDDWHHQRNADADDPNHHLYAWTPLLFANLLVDAGFTVESCRVYTHAWRRKSLILYRALPKPLYNLAAWTLAIVLKSRQIHAVCRKPG